eukprot:TRINITY_DN7473_c0_g1_i2.p1 TRINITY_DN7473_c0_g1~~TRINITY_DN7473_c0_g1_i2.p1  ORF type:complete len:329 (-),score=76.38 TRINITY_DN7473_c0_g1_i2:276-1262(-)
MARRWAYLVTSHLVLYAASSEFQMSTCSGSGSEDVEKSHCGEVEDLEMEEMDAMKSSLLQTNIKRHDDAAVHGKDSKSDWWVSFNCIGVDAAIGLFKGKVDAKIQDAIAKQVPSTRTISKTSVSAADLNTMEEFNEKLLNELGCKGSLDSLTGSVKSLKFDSSDLDINCENGQLWSTMTLDVKLHIRTLELDSLARGTLSSQCSKFPWAPVGTAADLFNVSYNLNGLSASVTVKGHLEGGGSFKLYSVDAVKVDWKSVENFKCRLVEERKGEAEGRACNNMLTMDLADAKTRIAKLVNDGIRQKLPEISERIVKEQLIQKTELTKHPA